MTRTILISLLIFLSINGFSQTYWRVENERGEELLLTIHINTANNTFETYTRKDALKEMAGTLMYMVAKTAGEIRYPELMHGEGKIFYRADTVNYDGRIDYPDKIFSLKAKTWNDNFYGLLTDDKNKTTVLTGKKLSTDKPIKDYPALINNSFSLIEKFYWDPNMKKSSDWKNFKSEINDLKFKIADDYELAMTMMWHGKKLATLVGQKSAGAPVLTNIYELDKQYRILIPFAQFYDKNGKSYQGTGVEPDLQAEENAVGYALKL